MCAKTILAVFFTVTLQFSESARILCVFPLTLASNQAVYRVLTDELLQRGHELVIITPDPEYSKNETPENLYELNVQDAYINCKAEIAELENTAISDHTSNLPQIFENIHKLFMNILENKEFQEIIRNDEKFDLLLLESSAPSSLFLSHLFKAPVVLISTFGSVFNYNIMGVPEQEVLYPSVFRQRTFDVPIWEKIYDIYRMLSLEKFLRDFENIQRESFKNIMSKDVPAMNELYDNVDLLLLNQFPVWEGIRPVPKNVINLGGLHVKSPEDLPQDLLDFFNSSTEGVIYINFGSSMKSSLSKERIIVIANVLSQLPYNVLWNWDGDELPVESPNIKVSKWLPQADLLRHPKIKLFITDGDLQATDEAIAAGVPLIGIPFKYDQFFNCENYVRYNIGLKIDFNTLTEEGLKTAITKIITDKGYKENVIDLRIFMRDQRQSSLNRAVWWIEHVLKHGGSHLRPPAANMPWYQYLELELLFFVFIAYVLLIITSILVIYGIVVGVGKCYRSYEHRRMMYYFPR